MNKDELLKIFVCPACHGKLLYERMEAGGPEGFVCERCKLLYPIENDIPVLMIDKALPLQEKQSSDK